MLSTFIFFTPNLYAWNITFKADTQRASTNNVNLSTSSNTISDNYSTYGSYLQAKNDTFKIKIKGKMVKYTQQKENDNYSYDLSLQYKRNKNNDYTFSLFKQVYNGTTLTSTDTTSNNNGGRIFANFSNDYGEENSRYMTLNGTHKKYSNMGNRIDQIAEATFGIDHYLFPKLEINPELIIAINNSNDSYYKNTNYGPYLSISYNPTEKWELFVNGSFTHTAYSNRNIQAVINRKIVSINEYQELTTEEIGSIYTIADLIPVQMKYSVSKNTSNNSASAYKAGIFSFGVSIKI